MLSRVRMSFVLPRRAAAAAAASRVPAGAVRSAVAASASAAAAQRRSLATGPQPKVMDYRDLAEPTERPPPYTGKEEYEEAREQARRAQDDGEYRGYNGSAGHMFHELLFSRSAIRSIAAAFVSAASVFLMGSYVLPENQRNVAEAQARDSDGNGHHAVRGGRASDLSGDVVPNSLEVIPSLGNPVPKVGDVVRYSIALEEEQKDGSVRSRPLRTFRRVVGNEEATLSGAALEAAKSLAGLPSGSQVSLRLKKDGKERKLVVVSSLERTEASTPEEAAVQKKSRGLKAKIAEARKNKQTPESRAALRKHLENMTPEQKMKLAEKYKALGDKKKKVKVLDRKALKRALEERKKKRQERKQQQQQQQ